MSIAKGLGELAKPPLMSKMTISHGAKTETKFINRVDSRIFPASDCCLAVVPPLEKFCPSSAKFRR